VAEAFGNTSGLDVLITQLPFAVCHARQYARSAMMAQLHLGSLNCRNHRRANGVPNSIGPLPLSQRDRSGKCGCRVGEQRFAEKLYSRAWWAIVSVEHVPNSHIMCRLAQRATSFLDSTADLLALV
jgi:hypothetical protein